MTEQQQPPARKHRKWPWVIAGVVGALTLVSVINAPKNDAATSAAHASHSSPSAVTSATAHPKLDPKAAPVTHASPSVDQNLAGPQTAFDDGTYLVGTDIQPGTYKTDGTDFCYWARLSSTDGTLGAIIANHVGSGPQVVTIAATDVAFQSGHCGTWVQVTP